MAVLNQKSVLDMIKEFRRNWHTFCNSERTTVCGADSMLLALQLSMAENNKQYSGEFTVSLSDVLLTWKYLLHEKLNLPVENMKVIDHYENIRKIYDDFLKNSNMLDMIDVYKKCNVLTSNCENYANISPNIRNEVGTAEMSQLRDFLSGRQYVVDNETDFSEPMSPISKHNQDNEKVQLLAKKIIYSYLNLLVNSKNDLALAHILNIPDRGLGREAFTDLKHAAREKQMSIFLPKSHAINHGTAYCGRDTVKTLLVLLDEEAASAPTKNKAELLYDDENTIPHNGTSILTLFRSPTQVNNSSMKPLRERIHMSVQEKTIKMKQTLLRSQFACTYKDDCMISKDKWNNVNSASKPLCVLHMEKDLSVGVNSSVGRPTIGTSSGNVHLDKSKNEKVARKSISLTGNKGSKRKQVDLDDENILCDNGNEPPQHKNVKIPKASKDLQSKLDGKLVRAAKSNKCTAKDKLITGQTKLTQFFRL
ncbi:PCNA-interacting partner isoform X4 [Physeter macrocephalus]|uniref:PCNA-interacting partner n=1 Tax=Physeter macrocephalus TaxID=9755 RepID=A0A2Y9T0Q4_PHYMC|nr:PCNA-interacting partner isoform X4 [Physeter catodon]|eukprot:XP_023983097.1 PCNA-interacting partner isoform X4 [Physeter catodon]